MMAVDNNNNRRTMQRLGTALAVLLLAASCRAAEQEQEHWRPQPRYVLTHDYGPANFLDGFKFMSVSTAAADLPPSAAGG